MLLVLDLFDERVAKGTDWVSRGFARSKRAATIRAATVPERA
jgi:hypothetical protein